VASQLSIIEIPWIHVGIELFTRPFLPSPLLPRPHRKGLGTVTGILVLEKLVRGPKFPLEKMVPRTIFSG